MRRALLLVALLVAAACGDDTGVAAGGSVEGRRFLSTSSTRVLVPGTRVQLQFDEDDRLSASAGCNSMSGSYGIEGGRLRVGDLATTEMGCDPQRHAQDEWLASLLTGGPQLVLEGDSLRLELDGEVLELLDREVAEPDRPLVGTAWELEGLIDGEAVSSVPVGGGAEVRFDGERVLVRVADCNRGSAPYEDRGGRLALGPLAMTRMGCAEPAASLEAAVVAVLDGEIAYEIDGGRLRLTHPSGAGLTFRAG